MNRRRATTLALSTLMVFAQVFVAFAGETHATTPAAVERGKAATKAPTVYSCPMHPSVKSKSRGKCPKCGMALRPVSAKAAKEEAAAGVEREAAETKKTEAVERLRIPETTVYDQNGRRLNFYTDLVRGKTVAINFIFTTCTTICPPLAATFRRVQQQLGERVGRDVEMISISVDPTTDTPERLKSFSAKFNAGPGWTFVTGSKPEIDQLLKALGASVGDKNNHSPMMLVGNEATGYWTRTYGLAPASTIVKVITEASAKTGLNTAPAQNSSEAAAGADGGGVVQTPTRDTKATITTVGSGAPIITTVSASAPSANAAETSGGAASKTTSLAEAAKSYFPNLVLVTQDDKPVRFYDDLLKGKIVLINFMFTTCTGVCTPMTANLVKVQRYLGEHLGREVSMISISVDPQTDSPLVLKKYADGFKAQPGWYFLTGKKENIDRVLSKLGGYVEDKMQHSAILIIGNEATGDWMKVHAMSKPAEIAGAVLQMIESQEKARAGISQSSR